MTRCVFCNKGVRNIADLWKHYSKEHHIEQNDPYLKEYISYLYNRQKGGRSDHEGVILCPVCAVIYGNHKTLLKHKLRRHTQQLGGGVEMDSLVSSSYRSTDIFSSYKISIGTDKFLNDYNWHDPTIVDAFLANAKVQFDYMRQKAIVDRTDQNKNLKFNIVYVIINQKNEGGYQTFATPWSKTSETFTGSGLFPSIIRKLSDSVKRAILVNNEAGSAFYFSSFEKLELNAIEAKNTSILVKYLVGRKRTRK